MHGTLAEHARVPTPIYGIVYAFEMVDTGVLSVASISGMLRMLSDWFMRPSMCAVD